MTPEMHYMTAYQVRVNGRTHFYSHLSNLKRVSRSQWTVERHGVEYHIEGGKHAGGTRRDWFVDGGNFNGPIHCTSLVDSLNLLETM